ncbi:MAG: phosphotyrosine protein phosphatase [Candidatus Latescibacterota bacterium]|nr:MAG: phosphotyrosine protein phosphatase [Candidatus Latescibacterota bacterium]
MNEARRILFVCSQNSLRSPTAEQLYRDNARLKVRSAGVDRGATQRLTAEMLDWAEEVFVFEWEQSDEIRRQFPEQYSSVTIECLNVPDDYGFMEPALVTLLAKRLTPYLGAPERTDVPGL